MRADGSTLTVWNPSGQAKDWSSSMVWGKGRGGVKRNIFYLFSGKGHARSVVTLKRGGRTYSNNYSLMGSLPKCAS